MVAKICVCEQINAIIVSMDELDAAIIAELEENARLSNLELARRVGLTPAPCLRRVQRLEREGILRGYRAVVDPKKAGRGFEVWVDIDVAVNNEQGIGDFESALTKVDEVIEARRMFGQPDYLLRVQVADSEEYDRQTIPKLSALPAVSRITSHMTMRLLKG